MPDNLPSEIGLRLRMERKRLRLTQQALGLAGGVSPSSQNSYESGVHTPTAEYLNLVAVAGVDIRYVVLGTHSDFSARDADWPAIVEIAEMIARWAASLPVTPPLDTRAHFMKVFLGHYAGSGVVDVKLYTNILGLVGENLQSKVPTSD